MALSKNARQQYMTHLENQGKTQIAFEELPDRQKIWLNNSGLKENPFKYAASQNEAQFLPSYFVQLNDLPIRNFIEDLRPWVVFARSGCGKTALRILLATRSYPKNPTSKILCVEIGLNELAEILELALNNLDMITPIHLIQVLEKQSIRLVPAISKMLQSESAYQVSSKSVSNDRTKKQKIFISYARSDRPAIRKLIGALEKAGKSVWYDRHLRGGHDWTQTLENRIKESDALIVVLSDRSRNSQWVKREVLYAQSHDVYVIPYMLEGTELPIWATNLQSVHTAEDIINALRRNRFVHIPEPRSRLANLVKAVQETGIKHLLCLIDEVDELPIVQNHVERLSRLLIPLMAMAIREVSGITFGFILPQSIEKSLHRQQHTFRLDRCRVLDLKWSKSDLQKLIRQRLIYCSKDQQAPHQSLGELCESTGKLSETIDSEIATLAESNPRAIIWLANRLIELHCTIEEIPTFIKQATWEQVKTDWRHRGRAQVFGAMEINEGFLQINSEILFGNRELVLSKRHFAILSYLLQKDDTCTTSELAHAASSDSASPKVKPRSIAETIRRLKFELQKQNVDPNWIQTIRGRGFQLRKPTLTG